MTLLRYNLEKADYRTITAQSGEEAVEAVRLHQIDAVLLDIMLPGLNGWEVCRILRESPNGNPFPSSCSRRSPMKKRASRDSPSALTII
jgi:two-component system alkaline phosphatase synthesis response regulator PhoP